MEKYFRLIERLIQQTESGQLTWEPMASENAFQVSFSRYTVRIASVESAQPPGEYGEYADDIVVFIHDDTGRMVDKFDDVEVRGAFPKKQGGSTSFARMSHLYQLARRKALGVEAALNDILAQLNGDEELPF